MAPQTRSHGDSSVSSDGKIYKSTAAAPKQQIFPARSKLKKTYGGHKPTPKRKLKQTTLKETLSKKSTLRQSTLTQKGFVPPPKPEKLLKSEDEGDEEEPELPAPAVKSKKRTRETRRNTTGDESKKNEKPTGTKRRRTLGDAPSLNPSSNLHTQTLTQIYPKDENGNENRQINDSQDDYANLILETPKKPKESQPGIRSSVPSLVQSVTPTNRRTDAVIPSSTSPATPPTLKRYSPAPHGSPLKAKSHSLTGPSPILKKVGMLSKDRVIPDSYSTIHSSPTARAQSPAIMATPVKKTRFDLPEDKENITPGRTSPKTPKPLRKTPARPPLREMSDEVPDSDDDIDGTGNVDDEEASTEDENAPGERRDDVIPSVDGPEEAETCYGVIGDETQAELISSTEQLSGGPEEDGGSSEPGRSRSATPTPNPKKTRVLSKAQLTDTPTSPPASIAERSPTYPQKKQPDESPSKTQTQIFTQGIESQRLPVEVINSLGPQNNRSDIIMSLHPEPLAKIINGTKNHEFRVWKMPRTVNRVWIYSTKPLSELKYMCMLSPPKVPGEIEDDKGVGNVEFNQGKTVSKYAYEILQVYELNDPVSLEEMKKKGWVNAAPQKYVWVPPAVVGELTANLKCALFEDGGEQEAEDVLVASGPNVTESQELRAQLQDDAEFSTQQHQSDHVEEVILSSQSARRSSGRNKRNQSGSNQDFAKPALPSLDTYSSIQSILGPPSQRTRSAVRPSQATTVSSPAVSPERLPTQVISLPSDPPAPTIHSSSPAPFRNVRDHSLRSSQFPTRSQMLPDSLINDEIQEPPPIIWDSADEQSD
ncbi:hypothetical protein F5Y11DRAFT_313784 [Daldinia sp. FL1419]|nr:hypothetical protein F5Y11DRAFT_313784 [Daldinia sp. FL1419]